VRNSSIVQGGWAQLQANVPKEEATQGCQGHHPAQHVAVGGIELVLAWQLQQLREQERTEVEPLLLLQLLVHGYCVPLLLHRGLNVVLSDLSRLWYCLTFLGEEKERQLVLEFAGSRNKQRGFVRKGRK
jgi:hypothetical protein